MKYVIKPTLILLLVALFTSINNDAFTQMIQINLEQTSDSYLNPNSLTINVDMELEASDESVETFLDEQLEEAFIHLDISEELKVQIRNHFKNLYQDAIAAENMLLEYQDNDITSFSYQHDMSISEPIYETQAWMDVSNDTEWLSHSEIFRKYLSSTPYVQNSEIIWELPIQKYGILKHDVFFINKDQRSIQTKPGYQINKYISLESDYIHYLINPKVDTVIQSIQPNNSGSILGAFMRF
jgi:hypothetical protein